MEELFFKKYHFLMFFFKVTGIFYVENKTVFFYHVAYEKIYSDMFMI